MRVLALALLCLGALALAASTYSISWNNESLAIYILPNTITVNGTSLNITNVDSYLWFPLPQSPPARAYVGIQYPASGCSYTPAPTSFSLSCQTNQYVSLVYVAAPGYSIYCDQQPLSSISRGLIHQEEFNILRLNCRLVAGSVSVALPNAYEAVFIALNSATVALSIAASFFLLIGVIKRRGVEASSR
ncbi:MAG: hypothetical protein TU35_007955 [Thermoproteus sp. AZ2]|jgi:hypothetical protein|uniref:Uncharacterized protein n=1 Tax=Thermoproteus sp. AZ2 TaxID=1609232 RepID=A0ACC6V2I9_9CREN|nr:MAG: hypothetical protein TU35_03505 [Thermoproteus sp. AZ2]